MLIYVVVVTNDYSCDSTSISTRASGAFLPPFFTNESQGIWKSCAHMAKTFPKTAQAHVASWLADGYLERRFPAGASEEEYELSTASRRSHPICLWPRAAALSRDRKPPNATSRRWLGLQRTPTPINSRRIDRLMAEQARIDKEIDAIQKGQMRVLPHATALERTREIITLTDDLAGDFRRVRDQFDQLNRDLRERASWTTMAIGATCAGFAVCRNRPDFRKRRGRTFCFSGDC